MFKKILVFVGALIGIILLFSDRIIGWLDYLNISPTDIQSYLNPKYQSIKNEFISYNFIEFINIKNIFIILLIIIFIVFLKKIKVISSNPCKRVKFLIVLKLLIFSPYILYKFLKKLHELEHIIIKSKKVFTEAFRSDGSYVDEIKDLRYLINEKEIELNTLTDKRKIGKVQKEKETLEEQIDNLRQQKTKKFEENHKTIIYEEINKVLLKYQEILNLFSSNVAINIKRFFEPNKLSTYIRVPSKYEVEKIELDPSYARDEQEEFVLVYNKNISQLIEFDNSNDDSVNSSYNHVCEVASEYNYYICNNLKKAKKKNTFYSSSDKYEDYYNSLLVFLICDKKDTDSVSTKKDSAIGILIFDSKISNNFIEKIVREIGGYLTHRLYTLLSHQNISLGSVRYIKHSDKRPKFTKKSKK